MDRSVASCERDRDDPPCTGRRLNEHGAAEGFLPHKKWRVSNELKYMFTNKNICKHACPARKGRMIDFVCLRTDSPTFVIGLSTDP